MQRFFSFMSLVRIVVLGLWVGVMVGFAFIFAPQAFRALGATPAFAALIAATIGAITTFGYLCGIIAIAVSLAYLSDRRAISIAIIFLILVMFGLSFYEIHSVIVQMQATAVQTPAYQVMHRESSSIYSGILLTGIIAWVLSALTSAKR